MNKEIELKYEFTINETAMKLLKLNYKDIENVVRIEKHNLNDVFEVELVLKRQEGQTQKATLTLTKYLTILDQKEISDIDAALLASNDFTQEIELIKEGVINNVPYMIIGLKLTNY